MNNRTLSMKKEHSFRQSLINQSRKLYWWKHLLNSDSNFLLMEAMNRIHQKRRLRLTVKIHLQLHDQLNRHALLFVIVYIPYHRSYDSHQQSQNCILAVCNQVLAICIHVFFKVLVRAMVYMYANDGNGTRLQTTRILIYWYTDRTRDQANLLVFESKILPDEPLPDFAGGLPLYCLFPKPGRAGKISLLL